MSRPFFLPAIRRFFRHPYLPRNPRPQCAPTQDHLGEVLAYPPGAPIPTPQDKDNDAAT